MESYAPNQYLNPPRAGSFQQHPSAHPYSPMHSEYGGGYAHENPAYAGSSSHHRSGYYPQQSMPHVSGMTPSGQALMEPMQDYDSGAIQPTTGPARMLDPDLPPLEEYYGMPPPRLSSRRSLMMASPMPMHLSASQPFPPRSAMRYSPPPIIPLAESSYDYGHRSRRRRHSYDSYGSYPSRSYRRSYSGDSYSPGYSYRSSRHSSRYSHYPTHETSTVVHQSRRHPTVVPINGGRSGYVVVPAKGQRLRVVDGHPRSFIGKIFSPSTWGFGRKRHWRY